MVQQNARLRASNDGTSVPDGADGPLEVGPASPPYLHFQASCTVACRRARNVHVVYGSCQ